MLVLTRKPQERIQIGDNITITIVRIKGRAVRVGIDAPDNVRIVRGELTADVEGSTHSQASAVTAPHEELSTPDGVQRDHAGSSRGEARKSHALALRQAFGQPSGFGRPRRTAPLCGVASVACATA